MDSFAAVIDAFGGPGGFEKWLGLSEGHGRVMKHRDSIPPEYWPETVTKAAAIGIEGISYQLLASLYAKRWSRSAGAVA